MERIVGIEIKVKFKTYLCLHIITPNACLGRLPNLSELLLSLLQSGRITLISQEVFVSISGLRICQTYAIQRVATQQMLLKDVPPTPLPPVASNLCELSPGHQKDVGHCRVHSSTHWLLCFIWCNLLSVSTSIASNILFQAVNPKGTETSQVTLMKKLIKSKPQILAIYHQIGLYLLISQIAVI